MAAMSGIIGGEVVLLGLIALPQMLRLGYNQNLAIGTICAIRLARHHDPALDRADHLRPDHRDLDQGAVHRAPSSRASCSQASSSSTSSSAPSLTRTTGPPARTHARMTRHGGGEGEVLFSGLPRSFSPMALHHSAASCRAGAYLTMTWSKRHDLGEGMRRAITLGDAPPSSPWFVGMIAGGFASSRSLVYGASARTELAWEHGKGLVPPFTVIGVVLGSIYGGMSPASPRRPAWARSPCSSSPRCFAARRPCDLDVGQPDAHAASSTGTIIWVTVGAAALVRRLHAGRRAPAISPQLIVGSELPTMAVLLTMMLILLFMGAFMDWVGIVLLIIPVFLPIVQRDAHRRNRIFRSARATASWPSGSACCSA